MLLLALQNVAATPADGTGIRMQSEVLDVYRFDRVGRGQAEHAGIKV